MNFNFKLNLRVSAFYLEKQKSFIPKKKFRPLSISKQKSFVYWLNFPEGFDLKDLWNVDFSAVIEALHIVSFAKIIRSFQILYQHGKLLLNFAKGSKTPMHLQLHILINTYLGGFQLEFVSISRVINSVLSLVEITAFRLESKSCKGFFKK